MDRERFGRALGQGAREAAKAVMKAADAAASPNPKPVVRSVARSVIEAKSSAQSKTAGIKRGSKRFGEAVWGPFVKLSGVLWLEVTGVFFGIFALTAAIGVWRSRDGFRQGGEAARHGWFAVFMLAVFGYFAVTSFVRAGRRGRRG